MSNLINNTYTLLLLSIISLFLYILIRLLINNNYINILLHLSFIIHIYIFIVINYFINMMVIRKHEE